MACGVIDEGRFKVILFNVYKKQEETIIHKFEHEGNINDYSRIGILKLSNSEFTSIYAKG